MLKITYKAARELLLWLSRDLSSGSARTGGESESRGIALQGQVSTPRETAVPALAGHLNPAEPRFLLDTTTPALPSRLGKVCARAWPTGDASSTCVSFSLPRGELLAGDERLGEA